MSWTARGTCVTDDSVDPAWFFTDVARPDQDPHYPLAMAACTRCPVQGDCLRHAIDIEPYGVWGGSTEKEREAIRWAIGQSTMINKGGYWHRLLAVVADDTINKFWPLLSDAHRRVRRKGAA